jgi:hypothetical protein
VPGLRTTGICDTEHHILAVGSVDAALAAPQVQPRKLQSFRISTVPCEHKVPRRNRCAADASPTLRPALDGPSTSRPACSLLVVKRLRPSRTPGTSTQTGNLLGDIATLGSHAAHGCWRLMCDSVVAMSQPFSGVEVSGDHLVAALPSGLRVLIDVSVPLPGTLRLSAAQSRYGPTHLSGPVGCCSRRSWMNTLLGSPTPVE